MFDYCLGLLDQLFADERAHRDPSIETGTEGYWPWESGYKASFTQGSPDGVLFYQVELLFREIACRQDKCHSWKVNDMVGGPVVSVRDWTCHYHSSIVVAF